MLEEANLDANILQVRSSKMGGGQQPERIPTLSLFIDELGVEYCIDLDELAEALKPFLKE